MEQKFSEKLRASHNARVYYKIVGGLRIYEVTEDFLESIITTIEDLEKEIAELKHSLASAQPYGPMGKYYHD